MHALALDWIGMDWIERCALFVYGDVAKDIAFRQFGVSFLH